MKTTCPTCHGKGTFHSAWKLGFTDQCADCHGTGQIDTEKRQRQREQGQKLGNFLAILFVLILLLGFLLQTLGLL